MKKKEKTNSAPKTLPTMDEVLEYLKTQSSAQTKRDLARAFHIKGNDRIHLKKILKDLREKNEIQGGSGGRKIGLMDALPEHVVVEITGLDSMGDLLARPLEWPADKPMPQITITNDKLIPPAGIGDVVQASVKPSGHNQYEGTTMRRMTAGENHICSWFSQSGSFSLSPPANSIAINFSALTKICSFSPAPCPVVK